MILSPFLYKEELISIFGSDLYEREDLLDTFKEILGYSETKPFECVGTYSEARYAVSLLIDKLSKENLPFLLSDPVGFIRKLPTDLVESFKSTLDEVREADLLLHIVDVSHPDFEEQIEVVNKTLADLNCGDKPMMVIFNKVDAFTYVQKDEDDLTPKTRENITLDELKESWMGKLADNCLFISARERQNIDNLKDIIYKKVCELHVQKYPYNDFLYQTYEEAEM